MSSNPISKLLLLITLLALTLRLAAQTDQGRVAGRVLDPNGAGRPRRDRTSYEHRHQRNAHHHHRQRRRLHRPGTSRRPSTKSRRPRRLSPERTVTGVDCPSASRWISTCASARGAVRHGRCRRRPASRRSTQVLRRIGATVNQREVEGAADQRPPAFAALPSGSRLGEQRIGNVRRHPVFGPCGRAKCCPLRRRRGHGDHRCCARQSERRGAVANFVCNRASKTCRSSGSSRAISRRVRHRHGRPDLRRHKVGQKSISRLAVRIRPQRRLRRPQLLRQHPAGHSEKHAALDQFGGSVGGPIIKDKLFFFA